MRTFLSFAALVIACAALFLALVNSHRGVLPRARPGSFWRHEAPPAEAVDDAWLDQADRLRDDLVRGAPAGEPPAPQLAADGSRQLAHERGW